MESTTLLGRIREYPGWQDAGQTGEDPYLVDDTELTVSGDGSVNIEDPSLGCPCLFDPADVFCEEHRQKWLSWLREERLLPSE